MIRRHVVASSRPVLAIRRLVLDDAKRIRLHQRVANPVARVGRREAPSGRARREHFDERKSAPLDLVLQRLLDRLARAHPALVVVQRDTLDVGWTFETGQQLAHAKRKPFRKDLAPGRRRRRVLAEQRRRRHLAPGHPVDRVVDKEDRDVLAAVRRVQDLVSSDRREVSVALVADHEAVGQRALDRRRDRGRAAVRHLDVADVKVVVRKDRAANGIDEHGAILRAELVDGLGHVLVKIAVAAARAIVGRQVVSGFAVKLPKETLRPLERLCVHGLPRSL